MRIRRSGRRAVRYTVGMLSIMGGAMSAVSCASSSSGVRPVALPPMATSASTTDPRAKLRSGLTGAGEFAAYAIAKVGGRYFLTSRLTAACGWPRCGLRHIYTAATLQCSGVTATRGIIRVLFA